MCTVFYTQMNLHELKLRYKSSQSKCFTLTIPFPNGSVNVCVAPSWSERFGNENCGGPRFFVKE